MISCGEPSGDLYAAALAREIRAQSPAAVITGFGGDHLRNAGAELLGDFSGLSVTGLFEVVRLLPRTYMMYRHLVAAARLTRPDVFVAIDFPDFNFTLAKALRKLGIPVIMLHQPAALGVAARPDEDDAQNCRSRARHLAFEERIYRDAQCRSNGSAIRCLI